MLLRFVQIADVHLDSKLTYSALSLTEEKRRERENEIRETVKAACRTAVDESADLVLIPGDLMDVETVSPDTVNFLIDTFADLAPMPVVISPGNHDFYSPTSQYDRDYLADRRGPVWPDNVHIFAGTRFESYLLPTRDDVAVAGCSHQGNQALEDHPLAMPLPRRADRPINLLCFHGSLLGFAPPGKLVTLPFTIDELARQGFTYAAVGHYHRFRELRTDDGKLLGAYAGCPASRGLDEAGEKGFLVVEIKDNGVAEVQWRRADPRILHRIEVDLTGCTHKEAIQNRVKEEVAKVTQDSRDMVAVYLTGRLPRGISTQGTEEVLAHYYHAFTDASGTHPDYDLEALSHEEGSGASTEGAFVQEMQRRLDEEQDPQKKRLIQNALYYGLDALIQQEVKPRYED